MSLERIEPSSGRPQRPVLTTRRQRHVEDIDVRKLLNLKLLCFFQILGLFCKFSFSFFGKYNFGILYINIKNFSKVI